ncbi:MAG TPA: NRDE family protein [Chitinophagaceae bacterium]|nr:NRDE family protein [Chitinophagaceae bacterium]
MCTVTYIPHKDKIFLTSNRDEKHSRADALAPMAYTFKSGKIFFPKDAQANGTWIALHENGNAMVLLNGGFKKHIPNYPYRKSRGLIFLEVMDSQWQLDKYRQTDLTNIEPFTLVMYREGELYECRWDGEKKHITPKDITTSHIWSSVTLYDDQTIARRNNWFNDFMKKDSFPSQDNIIHFHHFGGEGDVENDIRMNRDGFLYTVSITSIVLDNEKAFIKYIDLKNDQFYTTNFNFSPTEVF